VTPEEHVQPEVIVAAPNRGGAKDVVVGGPAVAEHEAVRATCDLEVVPASGELPSGLSLALL